MIIQLVCHSGAKCSTRNYFMKKNENSDVLKQKKSASGLFLSTFYPKLFFKTLTIYKSQLCSLTPIAFQKKKSKF